jgi:hypothetical protein
MSYQQPVQGYQPPAPPVDLQVHGTLVGVESRNAGWMRFLILEPGKQYPYKADTKQPDIIQQAMSLMNQAVSVAVREQDSTEINKHTGQPFKNRYLNAIAPQGYAPGVQPSQERMQQPPPQQVQQPNPAFQQPMQAMAAQPAPGPQQPVQQQPVQQEFVPQISGYEKDINIMRQTASKVVAMSLRVLPGEQQTIVGMVAACEAWMAYYVYGPLRFGLQPFSSAEGQSTDGLAQRAPLQPALDAAQADGTVTQVEGQPCPDCGFSGTHSIGCPRGDTQ